MKKVVLVLVAGISLASAKAQIQYGVKAGANFATITGSDASGAKSITNFNGGVFAKIPLAGSLSLQPEVLYSGQGAKATQDGYEAKVNLGYLNVPVLVKYNLPMGFSVQTGPQIGFLLSATDKLNGVSIPGAKSSYQSTDFSWDFGAGYVTPFNLGIEARYGLGLTKIGKAQDGDPAPNIKNGVFSVGLFYVLGGGKK
ncbi:MAG: porin family protein [Puia sp.]|nr:porin family protein [Puia sp.]